MNAFEYIVSELLHEQGYWTRVGYRVLNFTKSDKIQIGKATLPRPEIDIVGYCPATNEVVIVGCKSFIDSVGVSLSHFDGSRVRDGKAFKIFDEIVFQRILGSVCVVDSAVDHSSAFVSGCLIGRCGVGEVPALRRWGDWLEWGL